MEAARNVLVGVLLLHTAVNVVCFEFDHAFRSDESNTRLAEYQETLMKKIGLAMGEEEEAAQPLASHSLLRRSGHPEDQEAMESVESEQETRKLFNGKKRNRPAATNVTITEKTSARRTDAVSRRTGEAYRRREEAPRKKKEVPRRKEEASRRTDHISRRTEDVSSIPAQHRGSNTVLGHAAGNVRQLVFAASNNAFTPTTIATYLTQMWIGNIMQTVGWSLVGAFYSVNSGRSFPSSQRRGERDRDSVLAGLDTKAVAGILRGLAEAADSWEPEEL